MACYSADWMDNLMAVRSVSRSADSMVAPMECSSADLMVLHLAAPMAYCLVDMMDDWKAAL